MSTVMTLQFFHFASSLLPNTLSISEPSNYFDLSNDIVTCLSLLMNISKLSRCRRYLQIFHLFLNGFFNGISLVDHCHDVTLYLFDFISNLFLKTLSISKIPPTINFRIWKCVQKWTATKNSEFKAVTLYINLISPMKKNHSKLLKWKSEDCKRRLCWFNISL